MAELDLGINFGNPDEEKKYSGLHKNRRTQIERRQYDKMKRVEKQKLALEKLYSDDFINTLDRFYTQNGVDTTNYSKNDYVEKFYSDRIWKEYNTVGMGIDFSNVLESDQQYKGDWAEITQLYADLPMFGKGGVGFAKWAQDFVPALVADPLNLISFGIAGSVAKATVGQAAKEGVKASVKETVKQEVKKKAFKEALKKGAIVEGTLGATSAAGLDVLRQATEIEAGLANEYNWTRTMISAGAGGTASAALGGALSGFSSKGLAGRYFDKVDNITTDVGRDLGNAGGKGDVTYTGRSGKNKKVNPEDSTAPKTEDIPITNKTNDSETIIQKVTDIKRKTPIINLSKIKTGEAEDKAVNEIVKTVKDLVKKGEIPTKERTGVLETIKKQGNLLLADAEKLTRELELTSKVAPDMAKTIYAGRQNLLKLHAQTAEIRNLIANAVSPDEKLALSLQLEKHLTEVSQKTLEHVNNVRGVSDALNQQKLMSELTDADKLRVETGEAIAEAMPKMLDEIKKLSPEKKLEALDNLSRLTTNDETMRKLIRKVNRTQEGKKVNFFDALNEFTTANLLGDLTTHEVNILSAMVRYQMNYVTDFIAGIRGVAGGDFKNGFSQMQMAMDLFTSQFNFWHTSFKKAKLSWKANRSIGDTMEHKFDGMQTRNMETYIKQLKESDSLFKRWSATSATPLAKVSFITLKALQAGDTLMKNIFNRAQRVANVNQRMRTYYPDLWKSRKFGEGKKSVKIDENIKSLQENIRFEESKLSGKLSDKQKAKVQKTITTYNKQIKALNEKKSELTDFQKKWNELFFQYEDEFGNFKSTAAFNSVEAKTLDDLTKSIANDPLYRARENSFTQNLRNEMLDRNQFFPDQQQSKYNVGDFLLKTTQRAPLIRVLTGLHFVKTPIQLFRLGWQMTPILNRLNMEYNAMLKASDPIVRRKAQAVGHMGTTIYAMAGYMAFTGMLTGGQHPDRKKRYSLIYTTEDGETKYINLKRMFPLSIPFMVMADVNDLVEKFGDIMEDDNHAVERNVILEFARHYVGGAFSIWSQIFASNLMTQDFFKLMALVSDTDIGQKEGEVQADTLAKHFSRQTSKLVPLATQWRWQNKVLGEAEAELITMQDHIVNSSPYQLLNKINEYTGNMISDENFGNAMSPRRDMFGNVYPKPKGLFLGTFQDPFPYYTGYAKRMLDSNGNQIELSDRAVAILEEAKINWRAPLNKIDIGFFKKLDMKKTKLLQLADPNGGTIELPEGSTMWEGFNIIKGKIKLPINGKMMTLNEAVAYELDTPSSTYNTTFFRNRRIAGKYEGDEYLLGLIRTYERAARAHVAEYSFIEIDGKGVSANSLKKAGAEQKALNYLLQ